MGKLTHLFSHRCTIPKRPSQFSELIKELNNFTEEDHELLTKA